MNEKMHVAPLKLHRRGFTQSAAAGLSAAALARTGALAGADSGTRWRSWLLQSGDATPISADDYVPTALTDVELATLKAATGRLIPADDLGPGAIDAGVFIYIDRILTDKSASALPLYQEGLAALNEAAGGDFAQIAETEQDQILTMFEGGPAEADVATPVGVQGGATVDPPEGFFAMLLEHTRQGMFGDPVHGGNREFIGWDLINYPGIKIVWTAEDQAIGTSVEPQHISVESLRGN